MTIGAGIGFVPQTQLQNISMGIPLFRPATTLPQTGAVTIFNIVGGRVLLTSFIGECTVLVGAANGSMSFEETPTAGTMEIIATAVVVNNLPQGDQVGMTGLDGGALVPAAAGNTPGFQTMGRVLRIGTLDWRMTGNGVGEMSFAITYIPLDDGAYMTVA